MKRLVFEDVIDLGEYMYEIADEDSFTTTAVLLYDDAVELVKWLMAYEDIELGKINMENGCYDGYDKEYYITLDEDLVLEVEPACVVKVGKPTEYKDVDTHVVLYGSDASSKLISVNKCSNKFEIVLKEDYEDYDDYEEDCVGIEFPAKLVGFVELLDFLFGC